MGCFTVTLLEDRLTPSSAWLGDFTGPIQPRDDLLVHLRLQEPFTGPVLPPAEVRAIVNPVMPQDWSLDLSPSPELLGTPIGNPVILPPVIPLLPPYAAKPIGNPIILPPIVPLTDAPAGGNSTIPPRVPTVDWPATPAEPVDLAPDWICIGS